MEENAGKETITDRESDIYASILAPQQLGKCSESCLHGLPAGSFQNLNDSFPEQMQINGPICLNILICIQFAS